jgi:hypothetical protein
MKIRYLLLGVLLWVGMVVSSIAYWASFPVVQFSWASGECVAVVVGEGSCAELPSKYEKEWVK